MLDLVGSTERSQRRKVTNASSRLLEQRISAVKNALLNGRTALHRPSLSRMLKSPESIEAQWRGC